ncbi:MAG: acyltransferase [Lachnospiraceae bacterium]|nr:acyltransferase [Lachnospiraceae bacterium]
MSIKSGIKKVLKDWFHIGPEDINDYRKRGVKIGENVQMFSCELDYGHGYLIEIGDGCIITHTTILTHDASTKMYLGYSKIGRVKIGRNVFIGQGSIILPGVEIGDDVIVGAGSVVREDIESNSVVMGNPAKVICPLDKYIEKNRERMKNSAVFNIPWEKKTNEDVERIKAALGDGSIGYDV